MNAQSAVDIGTSVCAWCRSTYDTATGRRVRKLTDEEYAEVISHGCCPDCWHDMLSKDGGEDAK